MSKKKVAVIFPTYKENNQKYIALGHVTTFKGPFKHLDPSLYPNGFLNGIGGHVESGETVAQAAKREFGEEVEIHTTSLPTNKLVKIGVVDVTFLPEEKEIQLHVFRIYFPERVIITPRGKREFDSFDWYPLRNISFPKLGPNGAALLPSDKFWLPHFLTGKGQYQAEIEITNQFRIYETGEGDDYKSGKMHLRKLKAPTD